MPVKRYFEDSNREKGLRKSKKMLTGGQAKLDKNKNNKIDAEDFKMLRAGKDSMKAKRGKLVPLKSDPTKTVNPFLKRRKKLGGVKSLIGKGGRIGAAAAMLGLAGAGAAKIGQTIGRKIDEAKKKNKKMGGGMMKRPMGYTKGGGADTGRTGEARSKLATGIDAFKRRLKKEKFEAPKRPPMQPLAKKMGGGMVGKPVGYKSGKSVKVKCKLGRNKPTKMY